MRKISPFDLLTSFLLCRYAARKNNSAVFFTTQILSRAFVNRFIKATTEAVVLLNSFISFSVHKVFKAVKPTSLMEHFSPLIKLKHERFTTYVTELKIAGTRCK